MTDALLSVIVPIAIAVGVDIAAVVGSVFRARHGLAVSLKEKCRADVRDDPAKAGY